MFLVGCMGARFGLTYIAATRPEALPWLGALAVPPALGFAIIYWFGLRKTGGETFGKPIWWNAIRPVHAFLWAAFAVTALLRVERAWMILLADTLLGLAAWIAHRCLAEGL
jgi:hypothetical protein